MQLLHYLPRFLLRHKTIDLLCKIGLQNRVSEIMYNNTARAIIDLLDPEPRNVLIKGVFEPDFFHLANALIPHDGIYFDLGANVGLCSFGMIKSKPLVHFHLFEANPQMNDLLKQTKDLHQEYSIQLNQFCLSDRDGSTRFHPNCRTVRTIACCNIR